VIVVGNFDVKDGSQKPGFYNTGKWYELFSGDSLDVTATDMNLSLKAGEYRIYSNRKMAYPYSTGPNFAAETQVAVWPNPASDLCRISITVPGTTNCTAEIFALNGRREALLYSGNMNDRLSLEWNPPATGAWLLRVQAGNQIMTRKILVVK
jgi:1,4-alpha-glucan branching enzyme